MTNFEMVREFHEKFGHPVESRPQLASPATVELRVGLIDEERDELDEALLNKSLVQIADALTDLLYVIYGMGHVYGINLDKTFAEVHRSNLSKLGADGKPIYRESDGKILKGPGYSPPDLATVLGVPY